jgi:predicted nuclease of predicted toxin-antitoxin system
MKFLIDNYLSFKLEIPLQNDFPDTAHIRSILSVNADDLTIWEFARKNNYGILTKDNDFDERVQLMGCPPKVVHLVCGNKPTFYILNLILLRKEKIKSFAENDNENYILKIS